MDFVTAWKASSIVLTGAFGILGLATDFKKRDTNAISRWGYLSLSGILLSTTLGVIAQLKESSDDASKSLALSRASSTTLTNIERLLSPLDEPKVEMSLQVPCEQDKYRLFCQNLLNNPLPEDNALNWNGWPSLNHSEFLKVSMLFFVDEVTERKYIQGSGLPNLMMYVTSANYGERPSLGIIPDWLGKGVLIQPMGYVRAIIVFNDGKLKSTLDLAGATVMIHPYDGFILEYFAIQMKDGEIFGAVGPFQSQTLKGNLVYLYKFPSHH